MDWDSYFINMLSSIAAKSKLPIKVGCVIVGPNHEIRSTGFNGLPRGVRDFDDRLQFPEAYKWGEHADRNAIYNAARNGEGLEGCKIYLPVHPCIDCARAIISVGIKEVIIDYDCASERIERLTDSGRLDEIKTIETMFTEVGVSLWWYNRNEEI